MTKPKISVIVSCYNGEKYLDKCLKTLANQTLKDIEVICINDCSTDKTKDVFESYTKSDDRFKLINNNQNFGISKSRNNGLKSANAEYIMFCDADDYYEPTTCEVMLEAIESSQADLAINEIRVIYEAHEEMRYSDENYYSLKYAGLNDISDEIIKNTDLSPTNKIFRKSIIEKNSLRFPEGLHFEDAYFCSAYLFSSKTIYYVNENLYNYIRHNNSTMSNTWSSNKRVDIAIEHLYIAFKLFEYLKKNNLLEDNNKTFWDLYFSFEGFALANSKTYARKKQIRQESKEFCQKNEKYFLRADVKTQKQIKSINTNPFKTIPSKIKAKLVGFMPIYRIQVYNVRRLTKLKNKAEELEKRINRL